MILCEEHLNPIDQLDEYGTGKLPGTEEAGHVHKGVEQTSKLQCTHALFIFFFNGMFSFGKLGHLSLQVSLTDWSVNQHIILIL